MKKRYFLFLLAIVIVLISSGCSSEYKYRTNVLENYDSFVDALDVFLNKGETKQIDFDAQFKETGISITKIIAKSSNEDIFTIDKNIITATGMGQAKVEVEIYSKKENTCYCTTSANVYVVDANDEDIIEISTAQDLANMNQNLSGNYILKNDIDLKDFGDWKPIGNLPVAKSDSNSNAFCGSFINPNGYKIRNLNITSSADIPHGIYGGCYGGLFGRLEGAYIDGIILEDLYIDLTDFAGGSSFSGAGGIAAAQLNGIVRNCRVEGTIISQDRSGGIVGGSSWGKILNCSFEGIVKSTVHAAGGITGFGYIIKNCSVDAKIEGTYASGGIMGFKTVDYFISDCSFTGELLGNGFKNSIVGYPYS